MEKNKKITELNQSKYCYKGTDTLINKKDILDDSKLKEIEHGITAYKIAELCLNKASFNKTFDLNHYLNIHKYLFEDLYPFAGCLRDENISKPNEPYKEGKTPFCQTAFILDNLKYTLNEMRNSVRDLKTREDIVSFLAKYYLDLNIIHPFREGNGRTLREYLREYVEVLNKILKTDYILDYNIDGNTKESLVRSSVLDDIEETKLVFNKMLKEKEQVKNIHK